MLAGCHREHLGVLEGNRVTNDIVRRMEKINIHLFIDTHATMTFKSKLLRCRAQSLATCTDSPAPEACTEEPNAIEKFLNDASSVVAAAFPEATDDLSSEACSTITDHSEPLTYSYTADTETVIETDVDTRAGEADAMKIFLKKASTVVSDAVGSAFEEAASMAGDMHTIVTADIDEESASKEQVKQKSATEPITASFINTIKVKASRSNATVSQPLKETSTCETREEERKVEHPTSQNMEVKRNPVTIAKLINRLNKKGISSNKEAKESPATLAKLMVKLDKKEKQIKKINEQINKTEEEVVETKLSIRSLAAKYRGVLVLDGDEGDQTSNTNFEADETRDDQILDNQTSGLSDDDLTFDVEALSDIEEERDDDAIGVALRYTSGRLLALEKAANQVIFPHGV